VGPRFFARSAGDPPPPSRVLLRLAPQPWLRPPYQSTIAPRPLSEPDMRLSRIRLPATIFQTVGAGFRLTTRRGAARG